MTLNSLLDICAKYPQRFHIFGLNYLKGIEDLAPLVVSCDSSNWMRGRKYGFVIFRHTGNKHLTQAPARVIADYRDLTAEERCVLSTRNIEDFLSEIESEKFKRAA